MKCALYAYVLRYFIPMVFCLAVPTVPTWVQLGCLSKVVHPQADLFRWSNGKICIPANDLLRCIFNCKIAMVPTNKGLLAEYLSFFWTKNIAEVIALISKILRTTVRWSSPEIEHSYFWIRMHPAGIYLVISEKYLSLGPNTGFRSAGDNAEKLESETVCYNIKSSSLRFCSVGGQVSLSLKIFSLQVSVWSMEGSSIEEEPNVLPQALYRKSKVVQPLVAIEFGYADWERPRLSSLPWLFCLVPESKLAYIQKLIILSTDKISGLFAPYGILVKCLSVLASESCRGFKEWGLMPCNYGWVLHGTGKRMVFHVGEGAVTFGDLLAVSWSIWWKPAD